MRSSVLRKPQTTAGSSREAKQAEEQKGKKVSIPSDIKKKKSSQDNEENLCRQPYFCKSTLALSKIYVVTN